MCQENVNPIVLAACPMCGGSPSEMVRYELSRKPFYSTDGFPEPVWLTAFVFCHECGAQSGDLSEEVSDGDELDQLMANVRQEWNTRDDRNGELYASELAAGRFVAPPKGPDELTTLRGIVAALVGEGLEFFSYCGIDGDFNTHKTAEEAIAAAESSIDFARGGASDGGWPEELNNTCWGVVVRAARECDVVASNNKEFDYTCDYELQGINSGDVLQRVKGDGVKLFASDFLRPYAQEHEDEGSGEMAITYRQIADMADGYAVTIREGK
uniref:Uncharacterized protein n=1 Tax=Serratia proteamaculans (strain 568) TaxID=399741 RepID=A8GLP3_SERP5